MTLNDEERKKRMLGPAEKAVGHGNNRRHHNLFKNYDISLEEFNKRLKTQGGRCPICGREIYGEVSQNNTSKAVMDHDHKTRKNRGIICRNCNVGIGLLGDNVETLIGAVVYLKSFE